MYVFTYLLWNRNYKQFLFGIFEMFYFFIFDQNEMFLHSPNWNVSLWFVARWKIFFFFAKIEISPQKMSILQKCIFCQKIMYTLKGQSHNVSAQNSSWSVPLGSAGPYHTYIIIPPRSFCSSVDLRMLYEGVKFDYTFYFPPLYYCFIYFITETERWTVTAGQWKSWEQNSGVLSPSQCSIH